MNAIELPVSYGEAFDKLSILEIKLKYIIDDRKKDVEKEYSLLQNKLENHFNTNTKFHYRILKDINENIWIKQDRFRESENEEEKNKLCNEIIEENDRRFQVKAKINRLFESSLMEQKGYVRRKAFFLGHLGLGDMLTQQPIVRYLSSIYDRVVVVCLEKYLKNCRLFYQDDPTIGFYVVKDISNISINYGCEQEIFYKAIEGYDVYMTGYNVMEEEKRIIKDIPFSFYDDCKIDYSIFWNYFHIPRYFESKELYELVQDIPYCIIHNTSSQGKVFPVEYVEKNLEINRDEVLIINISENNYPEDHKWHIIAEQFVNKEIPFYKDTIENADYIFVSDSCLFCYALHLELKTDKAYVITANMDYDYIYSEKYSKDMKVKQSRFITKTTYSYRIEEDNLIITYNTERDGVKEIILKLTEETQGEIIIEIPDIVGREKTIKIKLVMTETAFQ
jgi:hypothetical protein